MIPRTLRPLIVLLILAGVSQAHAQSSQQLRQDLAISQATINELLIDAEQTQQQIKSLTQQLTQAQEQIATLQAQPDQPSPPEQPKAQIPTDPFAAPASMLAELRRRLARNMHGYPLQTDQQIAAYQRNVDKWCTTIPRTFRGKTTWLVQINILTQNQTHPTTQLTRPQTTKKARIQILDETLATIGSPFRVPIPNRFADRIERALTQDLWELTAFITAKPKLDPDRPDPGVFNVPDFLGPYAQFDFTMDWIALAPTTRTPTHTTTPTNKPNYPDKR